MGRLSPCSIALGLLAAACGASEPPPVAPGARFQLVELVAAGAPRLAESRRIARLEVPRALSPWQTDAPRHEIAPLEMYPGEPPVRAVTLYGAGRRELVIPGRYDPQSFNRLVLPVRTRAGTRFTAALLRDGEVVLEGAPADVLGSADVQLVALDLASTRLETSPFDALSIAVGAGGGPCQLGPIDFLDRPLAAWLPELRPDPRHVTVGEESRPAVGISSHRALRATLHPPRGSKLELSAAPLPALFLRGQGARLVVQLTDEARQETRRMLPLEPAGEAPLAWRSLRVDLDLHAGLAVELELTLVADGRHEAFALVGQPFVHVPEEEPPTVLLVTSDTHRFDHVAAHPASVELSTPAIDGLAARGVLFEDCWATTNVTLPSHAAIFTALSPRDTGVLDNVSALGEGPATLAERFRERGWATSAVIAGPQLRAEWSGLGRGFERVDAPYNVVREARLTIDRAVALAQEEHVDRPLFLWVHLFDAHTPYDPPPALKRRHWPPERGDPFDPRRRPPDIPERLLPKRLAGLRDLDFPAAMYRAEIAYLDRELARLLAVPRIARGVIAFTSDHGECLGEHGIWWDHVGLYPETLRVPLILVAPGLPAGARVGQPVTQLDLGRTLLDLAGLEQAPFPGLSLTRHLSGAREEEPRFALAAHGNAASVAVGPWLFVLTLKDYSERSMREPRLAGRAELYDLASDPFCARELSAAEPERAARLRELLEAWLAAGPDHEAVRATNLERLHLLEQLGYIGAGG